MNVVLWLEGRSRKKVVPVLSEGSTLQVPFVGLADLRAC